MTNALRLLNKIVDLIDNEDANDPLDDAINYAQKAIVALGVTQAPWRPIKNCPPGEAKFWAFQPDRGQYECWWHEDYQSGGYWMDHADSEPAPTHWMPLPSSPTSATPVPQPVSVAQASRDAIIEECAQVCEGHEWTRHATHRSRGDQS